MKTMMHEAPHRRRNPLTGEWVLVSPHRAQRPWQGQVEKPAPEILPAYEPDCYLCPGNLRASGERNPDYQSTFVFTNDYSALLNNVKNEPKNQHPLFLAHQVNGTCRVICFSPRHDLTLPEMEIGDIRSVVDVWREQTSELGEEYLWVQIFENKGAVMGCSNPHPHGQIWASDRLPNEPAKEDHRQLEYYRQHNSALLIDYFELERSKNERVVCQNDHWCALVPFWANWPFEILLAPKNHILRLPELSNEVSESLASIIKTLTVKLDNLFETSFPYSMGWHGAPLMQGEYKHWQLHAHFYPPLLRSATIKKFMVGYEMLAEPQRDLTPEQAARRLREMPEIHYKSG
jgi:UDPglucose--hexose-1-phosphate uridylyltransferase